jgi:hypothetical protein
MKTIRWFLPPYLPPVFVLEFLAETPVSAQVATQASLIEGAKKEGKVVWYATLNINDSNALLHRFEQKYPFIKTELLQAANNFSIAS